MLTKIFRVITASLNSIELTPYLRFPLLKNSIWKYTICIMLISLFMAPGIVQAAYLEDVPVTVTQPDGTELNLLASGDEYYNFLHDANDYTIIQDPDTGYYVYANLVNDELIPTIHIVGQADPARAGLRPNLHAPIQTEEDDSIPEAVQAVGFSSLFPSNTPNTGHVFIPVIFIRFADETEFTELVSTYDNAFNSDTPGVNSLYNYYQEVSYNQLFVKADFYPTPPGATVISYQDDQPRGYYLPYNDITNPIGYQGGNDGIERAEREEALVAKAVNYIISLNQFPSGAILDVDNDGKVDNVDFIISGSPAHWNSLLWPHMTTLDSQNVYVDGKRVYNYNFLFDETFEVGITAHEFFHSLGAPDLYRGYNKDIIPVGIWDVMANDLDPPQHMSCYQKFRYGIWTASIPEITTSGNYTLNPLNSSSPSNTCYKIASPYSNSEYFVLEYRRATGVFESSLPDSGLIAYRVNTAVEGNIYGPPDEVYVYRPYGTPHNSGDLYNAYFNSTVGRTEINDSTDPYSFLSHGGSGGLDISNIGVAGSTISFTVNILTPALPELEVLGNFISIENGDFTPSVTDDTDFSIVPVDSGFVEHTFNIFNNGFGDLELYGNPRVKISVGFGAPPDNANAGSGGSSQPFTVTQQPDSPVPPSGTTFTIRYDPDEARTHSADVVLTTNDPDEQNFSFSITGRGADPEINLLGDGNPILDGSNMPEVVNRTDFGEANVDSGFVSHTFTIENSELGNLLLDGTPTVDIVGVQAGDFDVTALPGTTDLTGVANTTFEITFDPREIGTRTATVIITSNDDGENPYDFIIQGTGTTTATGSPAAGSTTSRSFSVGQSGGTYTTGSVRVTLSQGVLPDGSKLMIDKVATGNFQLGDQVFDISVLGPNGSLITSFSPPLKICIKTTAAQRQAVANNLALLSIYHKHGGGAWLPQATSVDGHWLCIEISKLSLFAIGTPGMPATGFTPGVVTALDEQPASKEYFELIGGAHLPTGAPHLESNFMLEVPSLGVKLPIVGVPLTANGWDVSWLGDSAGYLEGTAFPTWAGNTAITAHVWDSNNNPGHFVNLHTLTHGDQVIIHSYGQRYIYEVRQSQQERPDTLRALPHEENDVLTLITCMGYDESTGEYRWRLAVRAVLISIE